MGQLEDLPVFRLPWRHNTVILEKEKNADERIWYAQKSVEYGWGRSTDKIQERRQSHYKPLPSPQSGMAQQSLKDPYVFDFLTLSKEHVEHDIEQGLIDHVQKMLLEMGKTFALVSRQYHMKLQDKDFYIDLLFYHYKPRCFVVVELKARKFDTRDVGKLNLYLSAVDHLVRHPEDKPTIGLLLCKTKDNFIAEYTLRNVSSSIGVAEHETEIMKKLPKELKSSLPTVEKIEAELEKMKYYKKKLKIFLEKDNTLFVNNPMFEI